MALIISKAPKKKQFIEDIFKAKAAQKRGIVRRSKASVDKYADEETLKAAVKKRGFHLLLLGATAIFNPVQQRHPFSNFKLTHYRTRNRAPKLAGARGTGGCPSTGTLVNIGFLEQNRDRWIAFTSFKAGGS